MVVAFFCHKREILEEATLGKLFLKMNTLGINVPQFYKDFLDYQHALAEIDEKVRKKIEGMSDSNTRWQITALTKIFREEGIFSEGELRRNVEQRLYAEQFQELSKVGNVVVPVQHPYLIKRDQELSVLIKDCDIRQIA